VRLRFGTDGVRGLANVELTPDFALAMGRAAARVIGGTRFVIGRDTRRSGSLLEAALAAGLASEGVDVELLGVVPTPAVAYLSAVDGVAASVITASHNPFADNGVKLFLAGGRKLTDDIERRIEHEMAILTPPTLSGAAVGLIMTGSTAPARYADHLVGLFEPDALAALHIVVDTANGAGCGIAGDVLRRLGARVTEINAGPDGLNINEGGGATHPSAVGDVVVASHADIGLALDGDADRVIAVGHNGHVVDGDQLIALLAAELRRRKELRDDTVVVTVMSNLGFHKAMERQGINVVTTPVGDRYVLEALETNRWSLGGEQSGHIIVSDLATTGDGLLSGLLLADLVASVGRPLTELASEAMTVYPQVLLNVRVRDRHPNISEQIAEQIAAVETDLGADGRVLVRPSGTEPLIRVMVEADTADRAAGAARLLADEVRRRFA
jgi:phosphoglucosamine mutase